MDKSISVLTILLFSFPYWYIISLFISYCSSVILLSIFSEGIEGILKLLEILLFSVSIICLTLFVLEGLINLTFSLSFEGILISFITFENISLFDVIQLLSIK